MTRNRFIHTLAACLATLVLAAGSTTAAAQEVGKNSQTGSSNAAGSTAGIAASSTAGSTAGTTASSNAGSNTAGSTVGNTVGNTASSTAGSRLSLRTNLLTWALGSPGLGLALDLSPRWQLSLDGSYGNWSISHRSNALRLSTAGVEVRRYFRTQAPHRAANCPLSIVNCPLFLGLDLRYLHFNTLWGSVGREGDQLSAGILAGYSFTLGHPRWTLDASIGLGYRHRSYDRYTWYAPAHDFRLLGHRHRNSLGLTSIGVALNYRL